ncbi:MAG: hypothetical protein KJ749_13145 [Planctomycetes bacterium]|nr:hypothetical protein [Planctomycetota bacterium]
MRRSVRKRLDQQDGLASRAKSTIVKGKERARRDVRLMAKLEAGTLPYTPAVMSWLSRQIGKKAGRITQEDVKAVLG